MYDITPTICSTSYTLYKASHQYFMRSHHIIYDITCIVFITWLPRYLTLHTQYLCPHSALHMISEQLYAWHHTRFIYDILCSIHNLTSTLWVNTIVVTALHPLHPWHHTHYIWYHTHENAKIICAIPPSISDTTSTVSVLSNPVYQLYYTPSLYDITHYMYDITFSMHDITWTLYDITPV